MREFCIIFMREGETLENSFNLKLYTLIKWGIYVINSTETYHKVHGEYTLISFFPNLWTLVLHP